MLHCNTDTHTHAYKGPWGNRTCNLERPVALGKVVGGGEKKKRENKKEMLLLQVLLDLRVVNEPAI